MLAGRAAGSLSRGTGRGSGGTLPGRVGLRLAPGLLGQLARGHRVLLVSGTNGKTTTTRYLAAAMQSQGPVLTNSDGANLRSGLTSTLLCSRADNGATAVLEVDERALPAALAELDPAVVLLLNLSRDQLDRTGELAFHVSGWERGLRAAPRAVVVANADDPLVCAAVLAARPDAAGVVWVGAGQPWHRDCPLCPRCGGPWTWTLSWRCVRCGFARPAARWEVRDGRLLAPGGPPVDPELGLPGRANAANAVMAVAAASCVGVPCGRALEAMRAVTDVAGRYLRAVHAGRRVRLLLAKNPAGWAEVLAQLDGGVGPVVVAVNARDADGADTSWLWDVPFERLRDRQVVAAGERSADVSVRLLYAGVEHTRQPDPLAAVQRLGPPGTALDVAANYTAFTRVRDQLLREAGPQQPSSPAGRAA